MGTEHRWVFDTNAVVSALLFEDSVPGRAFFHALSSGKILQSRETLLELQEVLGRKKFDKYLTMEEREAFLVHLTQAAILIDALESIRVCRDPKDDKFLELSVAGNASGIITGDDDLLALESFREIAIMTPARFLELYLPPASPRT